MRILDEQNTFYRRAALSGTSESYWFPGVVYGVESQKTMSDSAGDTSGADEVLWDEEEEEEHEEDEEEEEREQGEGEAEQEEAEGGHRLDPNEPPVWQKATPVERTKYVQKGGPKQRVDQKDERKLLPQP